MKGMFPPKTVNSLKAHYIFRLGMQHAQIH